MQLSSIALCRVHTRDAAIDGIFFDACTERGMQAAAHIRRQSLNAGDGHAERRPSPVVLACTLGRAVLCQGPSGWAGTANTHIAASVKTTDDGSTGRSDSACQTS